MIAIEEVDVSATRWVGRVVVEFTATDSNTSKVVWPERYTETEPLARRSPEDIALAVSTGLIRIVTAAGPRYVDASGGPAMFQLRVSHDDAMIFDQEIRPTYSTTEPNGDGCGENTASSTDIALL